MQGPGQDAQPDGRGDTGGANADAPAAKHRAAVARGAERAQQLGQARLGPGAADLLLRLTAPIKTSFKRRCTYTRTPVQARHPAQSTSGSVHCFVRVQAAAWSASYAKSDWEHDVAQTHALRRFNRSKHLPSPCHDDAGGGCGSSVHRRPAARAVLLEPDRHRDRAPLILRSQPAGPLSGGPHSLTAPPMSSTCCHTASGIPT